MRSDRNNGSVEKTASPVLEVKAVRVDAAEADNGAAIEAVENSEAPSTFTRLHLERLLQRFSVCFRCRQHRIDYFLHHGRSGKQISYALGLLYEPEAAAFHVCRFFPELFRQPDARYLSAAFFYFMVHHFAHHLGIDTESRITVKTQPDTYRRFYRRLADFSFRVSQVRSEKLVEIESPFCPRAMDLTVVEPCGAMRGAAPNRMEGGFAAGFGRQS